MLFIGLATNLKDEWEFSDVMGNGEAFHGNGEALYSLFFVQIIIIIVTTTVRKYLFAKIIELLRRTGIMTEYL